MLVRWSALEGRHVEREDLSSQRSPTLKAFRSAAATTVPKRCGREPGEVSGAPVAWFARPDPPSPPAMSWRWPKRAWATQTRAPDADSGRKPKPKHPPAGGELSHRAVLGAPHSAPGGPQWLHSGDRSESILRAKLLMALRGPPFRTPKPEELPLDCWEAAGQRRQKVAPGRSRTRADRRRPWWSSGGASSASPAGCAWSTRCGPWPWPQAGAAQTTDPPRSRGELTAADAARRPLAGLFRCRGHPEQVR